MNITCFVRDAETILCNGTEYHESEKLFPEDPMFWVFLGIYCALVLGAGLMSGLTIGLLSLDLLNLKVLSEAGSGNDARYAKRLFPIIRRHHWLLVTLLLGNAACVEAMPIFLDRVSDPVTAILVSVTAVLFFGEVIPQALCTRFGLAIGFYCSPIVIFFMAILSPIAWPISVVLDCLLGKDHEIVFKKEELKSLVGLHGPKLRRDDKGNVLDTDKEVSANDNHTDQMRRSILSRDEVTIIRGALELSNSSTVEVSTPLENVFMLSDSEDIDEKVLLKLIASAHSRVPIYHDQDRHDIRGLLLVKMLLIHKLECNSAIPIKKVMEDRKCFRTIPFVQVNTLLYDLLNIFQQGKSHMAVVIETPNFPDDGKVRVQGIITIEDVFERLLLEPIKDEADEIREEINQRLKRNMKGRLGTLGTRPVLHRLASLAPEAVLFDSMVSSSRRSTLTSDSERAPLLKSQEDEAANSSTAAGYGTSAGKDLQRSLHDQKIAEETEASA